MSEANTHTFTQTREGGGTLTLLSAQTHGRAVHFKGPRVLLNLISNAIACTMRGGLRGGGLIGDGARYEVCGEVHWEAWKDASQKKTYKGIVGQARGDLHVPVRPPLPDGDKFLVHAISFDTP